MFKNITEEDIADSGLPVYTHYWSFGELLWTKKRD